MLIHGLPFTRKLISVSVPHVSVHAASKYPGSGDQLNWRSTIPDVVTMLEAPFCAFDLFSHGGDLTNDLVDSV